MNVVLNQLVELQYVYIVWPNADEIDTVSNDFFERGNIPGKLDFIVFKDGYTNYWPWPLRPAA